MLVSCMRLLVIKVRFSITAKSLKIIITPQISMFTHENMKRNMKCITASNVAHDIFAGGKFCCILNRDKYLRIMYAHIIVFRYMFFMSIDENELVRCKLFIVNIFGPFQVLELRDLSAQLVILSAG